MTVKELVFNLKSKEFKMGKSLQVKEYLPIAEKKEIAKQIIEGSIINKNGVIKIDSVERYMLYVKHMILSHTILHYTDADYDMLCSTEYNGTTLLNAIMELFAADAQECTRILNLMTDDYMQEMSLEFTLAKFLNKLSDTIDDLSLYLESSMDSALPEDMDIDKLNSFLKTYIK